jgi:hypothetical protein
LQELTEKQITGRTEWFNRSQNSYQWAAKHELIELFALKLEWNERNSWSLEKTMADISKHRCRSLRQWRKGSPLSYAWANKQKIVKEIEAKLGWKRYRKDCWSLEELISNAKKCGASMIQEWRNKSSAAYSYAKKYQLVQPVVEALDWTRSPRWTHELCIQEIIQRRFRNRTEWARGSSGSYSFAQTRGVLNLIWTEATQRITQFHRSTSAFYGSCN